MPVEINGLPLYNGTESQSELQVADMDVRSPPTRPPEETLLTGLSAVEEFSATGTATGTRISQNPEYSNDPEIAIREWALDFLAHVNARQGEGWTLSDGERDRDINIVIEEAGIMREKGNPLGAKWNVNCVRGKGTMSSRPPDPPTINPDFVGNGSYFAGYDLGTITQSKISRKEKFEKYPLATIGSGSHESNIVLSDSGVVQQFMITGVRSGSPSELRQFANDMQSLIGGDQIGTLRLDFPGVEYYCMVNSFDHTFKSGRKQLMDYAIKLTQGTASGEYGEDELGNDLPDDT